MGAEPSKYNEPLQPQPQPLWAIERRFCVPHPVTLRLREKFLSFSGDDFKISDANSGQVCSLMFETMIHDVLALSCSDVPDAEEKALRSRQTLGREKELMDVGVL